MKLEVVYPDTISAELNVDLLQFYQSFHINGWADLKMDRQGDFFGHYRTQSDEFCTYLLRDEEKNTIEAMASFIFREVMFQGQLQKIAYATDLRVSNSRKAILEWTQHFLPVMEKVQNQMQLQHIFSAIDLSESSVINAFLRPRNMKRSIPRYYLYRKFFLTTLHGRFPWAQSPLRSLRIREGSEANKDAMLDYLLRRYQYRPFCSIWDRDSFNKKISRLPGFKISDFLIAFDGANNVVGCLAPWDPSEVQSMIPYSFGLYAHNFRQFLKFGQLLGWSHPLTKPYSSTGKEEPLNFRWLTHIAVDNEDIFESLIWEAYARLNKNEFLAYTQVEQDFRTLPPNSWISARMPRALYSIVPPTHERPEFLHPSVNLNPEIEAIYL